MAADVVGFSRLMANDDAGTLAQVRNLKRDVIERHVGEHGGRLFKVTGDGFFAEFPSSVKAVEAAVAIQRTLALPEAGSFTDLKLRIGVNLGDIMVEQDGDVYGDGVNVAARLEQLAEPGSIFISGKVFQEVRTKVPFQFSDLGTQTVKNIPDPISVFRIDEEGVRRRSAFAWRYARSRLTFVWVAFVCLGVAGLIGWHYREAFNSARPLSPDIRGPTVAILPVAVTDSSPPGMPAELSEQIAAKLGKFRELRVILPPNANEQNWRGKGSGSALGAHYLLSTSFHGGNQALSLNARLVEAKAGTQIWADTFRIEAPVAAQQFEEDASRWISSTLGGWSGVIALAELQRSRDQPPDQLSAYECMVQAYQSTINQTSSDLVTRSRSCLSAVLKRDPRSAQAWAMLAQILALQRWWGTGLTGERERTVVGRAYLVSQAVEAANKAVELAPDDPIAHFSLMRAFNLACAAGPLRVEADRTLALNPDDPSTLGAVGNALAYNGFWDPGVSMIERAMASLGPRTPRWWWWAIAKSHWRKGEYEEALRGFDQSFNEQNWLSHLQMAYALPPLGKIQEAHTHVQRLLELYPSMNIHEAIEYYRMFCLDDEFLSRMSDELRKAGLPN
jgi:adenylate cyclase